MGSIMKYMPLISEGSNMASGILGTLLTNRANKRMADTAFQRNVQMWNMQNAYNSPAAQMARFKQAGLNPNLIYGQGTPGNSSAAPRYDAPRLDYSLPRTNVGETLGQYMDLKLKGAQIANVTEQNRSIRLANDTNALKLTILQKYGMLKERAITGLTQNREQSESWRAGNLNYLYNYLGDTYDSRVSLAQSKANIIDQQYLNTLLDNSIKGLIMRQKGKDVEYLDKGGKFFSPVLQLLRMIFGK